MDDRLREQRYQRLQFLLSKSNMYTSYLVQRMEQQAEEEKEKLKRKEKRKQNQQLKEAVSDNKVRVWFWIYNHYFYIILEQHLHAIVPRIP